MPPLAKNIMVDDIVLTARHRKDMGDLQALADSIEEQGLLQPIGVDLDNTLVFGERRLLACRDILGWDRLPAVIVHVTSLVAGEYAENEIRKNFTKMERVAIGKTLEAVEREKAKERQSHKGVPDNCPEPPDAGDTRDIVAKKVGFGSGKEYERAKLVDARGSAELKAAVDSGDIAISKAAELTTLPKAEQTAAVKGGKKAVRQAAKKAAQAKAPKTSLPAPKKYPVSDRFDDFLGSIVGFSEMVKRQHGTTAKMLAHKEWDPGETKSMIGLVRALNKFLAQFEKDLVKHDANKSK